MNSTSCSSINLNSNNIFSIYLTKIDNITRGKNDNQHDSNNQLYSNIKNGNNDNINTSLATTSINNVVSNSSTFIFFIMT